MIRQSNVALVVARLRLDGVHCLMLQRHRKWSDWSLVGGHVEPDEIDDWYATAVREADEELVPWRHDLDFVIDRSPRLDVEWGPVGSRSAGNAPTRYTVAYFGLRFLVQPVVLLARLTSSDFAFIELASLRGLPPRDLAVAEPVVQLAARADSLDRFPLSWPTSIDSAKCAIPVMRPRVVRVAGSGG